MKCVLLGLGSAGHLLRTAAQGTSSDEQWYGAALPRFVVELFWCRCDDNVNLRHGYASYCPRRADRWRRYKSPHSSICMAQARHRGSRSKFPRWLLHTALSRERFSLCLVEDMRNRITDNGRSHSCQVDCTSSPFDGKTHDA